MAIRQNMGAKSRVEQRVEMYMNRFFLRKGILHINQYWVEWLKSLLGILDI
jgi:hypothetical protein